VFPYAEGSGAERVLAAPGVAGQIRVTPDSAHAEPPNIGGEVRMVHPAEVTLRLSPELGLPGVEWHAEVGFFLAVEDVQTFDRRFA
jgi:hypothetical protein